MFRTAQLWNVSGREDVSRTDRITIFTYIAHIKTEGQTRASLIKTFTDLIMRQGFPIRNYVSRIDRQINDFEDSAVVAAES